MVFGSIDMAKQIEVTAGPRRSARVRRTGNSISIKPSEVEVVSSTRKAQHGEHVQILQESPQRIGLYAPLETGNQEALNLGNLRPLAYSAFQPFRQASY
jgi:hypothetical protein